MQAMVLRTPGPAAAAAPLSLEEREVALRAGEVALRVLSCGVCRTDLQICEGDLRARVLPIVPGHQIVGVVERLGDGVTTLSLGQRVGVAWLASTCGVCRFCTSHRENICERATFTGWDRDGGYATRAIVRADFAFPIPEGPAHETLAPLLCGGVIGYRSLLVSGIQKGQKLGLYGFGASALLAIQIAVHWGCEVFVCTRSERERARARSLGAVWTGGYEDTPPAPLEAAVTFAPSGDVVIRALEALDRGGTVAINAIHLDRIPQFSYDDLWWEKRSRSVANFTRDDARALLDLAVKIPITTAFETHPLRDANLALLRLREGKVDGAAVLVMP
jgi:propanol-preferring alcohol dehydrogenase